MSFIIPTDVGPKYRYLFHSGMEYVSEAVKALETPEVTKNSPSLRFTLAIDEFFEKSIRGSADNGSLEDVTHFRLSRDALNIPEVEASSQLRALAKANTSFVSGTGTSPELTSLHSFFSQLFRLSDQNVSDSYFTGKASKYVYT